MQSHSAFALAAAALTVLSLAAPTPASACGMSVNLAVRPAKQKAKPAPSPVLEVAAAEHALEQAQPLVAARKVLAVFPGVRSVEGGRRPLETRALRVFALAVVRADGDLPAAVGQGWTRAANLEWAVQSLKEIDASRPNEPSLQADLGEAMAHLPRMRGQALTTLDKLAQKDLMGSPQAYAALSRLRAERGDSTGAAVAMKRCEGMAATPSVCAAPSAKLAAAAPERAAVTTQGMLASRN